MIRLRECSYKHCRLDTKASFRKLNFGDGGMMLRIIRGLHREYGEPPRDDARVVYAKDGNVIIGWAILVDPAVWHFGGSEAYFYVDSKYRRKGIGTRLMKMARRSWGKKFNVCRHDEVSTGFFNKVAPIED